MPFNCSIPAGAAMIGQLGSLPLVIGRDRLSSRSERFNFLLAGARAPPIAAEGEGQDATNKKEENEIIVGDDHRQAFEMIEKSSHNENNNENPAENN
jgi:hypothetical protein